MIERVACPEPRKQPARCTLAQRKKNRRKMRRSLHTPRLTCGTRGKLWRAGAPQAAVKRNVGTQWCRVGGGGAITPCGRGDWRAITLAAAQKPGLHIYRTTLQMVAESEIPFFFGQICLSFSDKPKSCPSRTLRRAILFDDRLQIVDYVPNKDDAGVLLAHLRCSEAVWKG